MVGREPYVTFQDSKCPEGHFVLYKPKKVLQLKINLVAEKYYRSIILYIVVKCNQTTEKFGEVQNILSDVSGERIRTFLGRTGQSDESIDS